jgi:hypothetical protein
MTSGNFFRSEEEKTRRIIDKNVITSQCLAKNCIYKRAVFEFGARNLSPDALHHLYGG